MVKRHFIDIYCKDRKINENRASQIILVRTQIEIRVNRATHRSDIIDTFFLKKETNTQNSEFRCRQTDEISNIKNMLINVISSWLQNSQRKIGEYLHFEH